MSVAYSKTQPKESVSAFFNPEELAQYMGIRSGMKVADFGSGSGFFAVMLARATGLDGHVWAVDILESAGEAARSRAKFYGLPQVTVMRGDVTRPGGSGLADRSCDLVLCSNLFFQVKEHAAVLQEVGRVLQDKGTLVVIEWKADGILGPPKDARVSRERIIELADQAGFTLEKEFNAGSSHIGLLFRR